MAENKKDIRLKKILMELNSDDEKKVSKAIKSLETHGDVSFIKPLAEKLLHGASQKNQGEIIELLCSIKDSSVTADIMDVIENEKFKPIRKIMLSIV